MSFTDRLFSDEAKVRLVWATAALALAARLYFVLSVHPLGEFISSDMWVYDHRAAHFFERKPGPWDTFTPLGYPAFLAVLFKLFGKSYTLVGVLQAFMGAGAAALSNLVAARVTGSNKVAALSGVAVALYFPLIFYTGLLLTEAPSAFLLLLATWLTLRGADEPERLRFLGLAGVTFGVATVVRPNLALALPLTFFFARARFESVPAARAFTLKMAGFAVPALLWASVHNTRLMGKPTGIATNGGLNFFLAHAQVSGAQFQEGALTHRIIPIPNTLRAREPYVSPVPFYDEGYFYKRGLQELTDRPYQVLASLDNVNEGIGLGKQDYWPWWHGHDRALAPWSKLTFWFLILPAGLSALLLASLGRIGAREESGRLLLFLFCASTIFTLYAFLGDPRVRVPFDPLFIILAIDAWVRGRAALAGLRTDSPT